MKISKYFLIIFLVLTSLVAQNKILSSISEDWKKIETKEFIIYYPINHGYLALKTSPIIKNTIEYYSKIFQHRLTHQIIFFVYPSFLDFQSSNIIFDYLPEGVAGYTEPIFERVVLPYNGNWEDYIHTITHEMVHSFQFDIIKNVYQDERVFIPLWIIEGMAEFLSIGTGSRMDEYIRDLVYSKKLPDMIQLLSSRGYENYKIGQSIMYYIYKQWGIKSINDLFRNLLIYKDLQKAFQTTFYVDYYQFNQLWLNFIYDRYKKETINIEEYKDRITFRYRSLEVGENIFKFKPAFSLDGRYFAYITADKIYPTVVIQQVPSVFLSDEDLKEKKETFRYLYDEYFEEWQPLTTKLNFDPTNQFLYIPTRSKSHLSFIKYDVKNQKINKIYKLNVMNIREPNISSNGKFIVFVGTINGFADIFVLDLETENLQKITNDFDSEINPVFSLDNYKIYYIKNNTIFEYDLQAQKKKEVLKIKVNIESLKEGYFKIQDKWTKGFFLTAPYKDKISLFFYNFQDRAFYHVSSNSRDIISFDIFSELTSKNEYKTKIFYMTLEEGAYEFFFLDFSKSTAEFKNFYKIDKKFLLEENNETSVDTKDLEKGQFLEQIQTCCEEKRPQEIFLRSYFKSYKPTFYRYGFPFIAITGASDNKGKTSLAFLGLISFSDLQNKHIIEAFITYQEKPVILNGEFRYNYKFLREEVQIGGYSYNGVFTVFNPLDLSLNYLLYNPFQRLIANSMNGIYINYNFLHHSFSKLGIQLNIGREEQIFAPQTPEQRKNNDIFKNYYQIRLFYTYDNAKYTLFGPLDGYAFLIGYEIPIVVNNYFKNVYQTIFEFRYYNLFEDFSLFAYRLFMGMQTGKDAKDYPYRIGGYDTIRGYEFQKFEGRYAFVMNIEYRFTFIEFLQFAFPFRWNIGLLRAAFFLDAGAAFDNPKLFQAFDGDTHTTKDLKASIGIGLHWSNFLWFIFPGGIMKIEWASPYDGKRSLPFSKWEGRFSLGFNF